MIELTIEEKENVDMGLLTVGQTHKPTANDEQKQFKGDGIAKVNKIKKYVKEGEAEERLIIEMEIIRAIPDPKGREITLAYGDKIAKFYKESGGKKSNFEAFFNDMFTAGINIDTGSAESLELSLTDAVNKKVYLRCWISEFVGDDGSDVSYQNVLIKSEKLITDELATPEIPI